MEWNLVVMQMMKRIELSTKRGRSTIRREIRGVRRNFKAYCHDVTLIPAQRMKLLNGYLSLHVRSSTVQNLQNPNKYTEALQALQQLYVNRKLIDRAKIAELMAIPALKLFILSEKLRDCITALKGSGCQRELLSVCNLDRLWQRSHMSYVRSGAKVFMLWIGMQLSSIGIYVWKHGSRQKA